MKLLYCIASTLSLVSLAIAAPQPLSAINTTVSALNDSTTASVLELASNDSSQSTPSSTSDDLFSITDSGGGTAKSITELANAREDIDSSTSINGITKDASEPVGSDLTESTSTEFSKEAINSLASTGNPFSRPAGTEESETEIPITRYVPPLDPLKHMMMRADVKGMPNLSNLVPKVNFKPVLSTTDASTSKNPEYITENISNENSEVEEKVLAASSEIEENLEKISTETPVTTVSEMLASLSTEKELDMSTDREIEDSTTKATDAPLAFDDNSDNDNSKTTASDVLSSATALLKSDELKSVEDIETERSNYTSTQSIPTSTDVSEITLETTVNPEEVSETLALHRNSEIAVVSEKVTTESEKEEPMLENETSAALFTSTEEAIKIDDLTNSDNLLKSVEVRSETALFDSEETTTSGASFESEASVATSAASSESELTTLSTAVSSEKETTSATSTENSIELKNSEISTSKENKDITSTAITTIVPDTTSESSTSTVESEKKAISLEDELEFRAVKIPMNNSKVSYVKDELASEHDTASVESNPELSTEAELTTSSIFTTIAEILFSSSTIEPNPNEESLKEETSSPLTEKESESTELSLPIEKLDLEAESDSGTVLANDPADMLKVQSVTAGLDSVPAEETSTFIPLTESAITETSPEKIWSDELERIPEELAEENVQKEKISETTVQEDAITKSSSTPESQTSEGSTSTTPISVTEAELEKLEHKNDEILSSEPETQTDASSEEEPSDYLQNTRNRYVSGDNRDMVAAVQFLHYHDKASSEQCFKLVDAHWKYATNLTDENKRKQLEQTLEYSLFHKAAWKNATSFAWKSFNDTLLRRWFKSLSVLGTSALPEDKLNEFNRLKAEMKNTYSTSKICTYIPIAAARRGQILQEKDCNLTLEPDLQRILTKSRDYDELVHVWKSWREAAGKPNRDKYLRFVELSNEAARLNGFSDTGDMWREAYETETFETDLEELWEQVKPLYEHLHAYVRRRLIKQYGEDKIRSDGPIPAHLFGNMWAQSWVSLLDITQPFPGKPSVDVTPIMESKNMTANEMFKISEEFFTSLGLKSMPESFWKHSLIEKPKDREIICHASAWDFCNGKDYRIKQCTDITMEDLITVHHEMGHIQYFLQYARQPNVFREGANPGFHEAIGDVLALSVSTPKHLKSIGLLDEVADDPEGDLNFLLFTALDKVSFLPSGYLIDLWRWGLFSGDIKPEEMNTKWWELRSKYQGICPPVKRTDSDFDPGAKYHVPGNVPYIRYFVSFVIQFQFHKVLCDAAGHTGPLYKCDIYRSKEAGQILSQVMELGSSEHWSEAMKIMTGGATNKMDAGPILEYFEPLLTFLEEQNRNETIGWRSDDPTVCP